MRCARQLGARSVVPLYGSVDPDVHRPGLPKPQYSGAMSYLGTYAVDRQPALQRLFLAPARLRPERRFVLAGAMYPQDFPWLSNVYFVRHLPPSEHAAFYASSRLTLNVTRAAMAAAGWCPSGRLFEAAACGVPVLSDAWPGLDEFFTPGREILVARDTDDALAAHRPAGCGPGIDRPVCARAGAGRTYRSAPRQADGRGVRECRFGGGRMTWGIIPAAGNGMRIQPLAFSKELLPVGSRIDGAGVERPRAVSEYLVERMVRGGASKLCFVISPWKSDILQYYGGAVAGVDIAYVIQSQASGLCDAIFCAVPLVHPDEAVLIGLPDTVWFPEDAFGELPDDRLSLLLFQVQRPELFDAVLMDDDGRVREIQVKSPNAGSNWIWGGFKMPGHVLHSLRALWWRRARQDEYLGTLLNAWLAEGNACAWCLRGRALRRCRHSRRVSRGVAPAWQCARARPDSFHPSSKERASMDGSATPRPGRSRWTPERVRAQVSRFGPLVSQHAVDGRVDRAGPFPGRLPQHQVALLCRRHSA